MNLRDRLYTSRVRLRLVAVLAIVFCVYLRSLAGEFVYDDHAEIAANRYLAQWSFVSKSAVRDSWWFRQPSVSPQSAYYRPVQNAALAFSFHISGRNPWGWHLIKIALHLIATGLVFWLATVLTKDTAVGLLSAIFFGLHPVHVESVSWIAALPEPLASAFIFAAFCCFARRSSIRGGLVWASVLFASAVLSHEGAVAFPLLFTLYALFFESSDGDAYCAAGTLIADFRSWRTGVTRALWQSAPFYATTFLYLLARTYALGLAHLFGNVHIHASSKLVERRIVQLRAVTNHSALQLVATVPLVMTDYLKLLFFPWTSGPAHPAGVLQNPDFHNFYVPVMTLMLTAAAAVALVRYSPRRRIYIFCFVWFVVGLAPAMNFDQVVEPVQDRYVYLASFAWCVVIADLAVTFAHVNMIRRGVVAAACAALVVLYVAIDWNLQRVWHDDLTLFTRCVVDFPDSTTYRMMLSRSLERNGDLAGATAQLSTAVTLEPGSAALHHKLGALYLRQGRKAEAQKEFDRSFAIFAPWALGNDSSHVGSSADAN
jgi:hypothetical protein